MPSFAHLHLPTLTLLVCIILTTAAAIMTLVGMTQRTYRGYWWWTAAQWVNMLGAACLFFKDLSPWMLPLSVLLSMQWPLTMLGGMRRFYARSGFPTPAWVDLSLPLLGAAAYSVVWFHNQDDVAARVAVFSLFNIGCYLYTAWHVQSIRDWRQSPYLKAVLIFLVVGALIQVPRLITAMGHWGVPVSDTTQIQQPVVLLALVIGVMFSVYMCLLLTYERTEQDLRESHRQLRVLADFDMLTQVPNRRHFNEMAEQTLRLCAPGSTALMRFDIDHFKQVNDVHGHAAGDEALKLVAGSARKMLRSRDLVGRLGGDEFIALLPETSIDDALHVAERMVRHVDHERQSQGQALLSLSFGVVQITPGEALIDAIHRADQALAEARRQGRSRVVAANVDEGEGESVFKSSRPLGLTPR
jgi:diguanylate cyclase (GGDEF)-like protein